MTTATALQVWPSTAGLRPSHPHQILHAYTPALQTFSSSSQNEECFRRIYTEKVDGKFTAWLEVTFAADDFPWFVPLFTGPARKQIFLTDNLYAFMSPRLEHTLVLVMMEQNTLRPSMVNKAAVTIGRFHNNKTSYVLKFRVNLNDLDSDPYWTDWFNYYKDS